MEQSVTATIIYKGTQALRFMTAPAADMTAAHDSACWPYSLLHSLTYFTLSHSLSGLMVKPLQLLKVSSTKICTYTNFYLYLCVDIYMLYTLYLFLPPPLVKNCIRRETVYASFIIASSMPTTLSDTQNVLT